MDFADQAATIRAYVLANVDRTLKPPNRMMKHPFIDPGSVYEGNLWDWDSFWASHALLHLAESAEAKQGGRRALFIDHARGNVLNFLDFQLSDGYVPIMVQEKDFPEPYLNARHREGVVMNMHKPFLCQQIRLVSEFAGDWEWIRSRFDQVEGYFSCYDRTYFNQRCGLYVWANDIMIGT